MVEATEIKPPEHTVNLYQGDDQFRIQEALTEMQHAVAPDGFNNLTGRPIRLGDPAAAAAAAAKYDELVKEAEPRAIKVTMRALPRKEWRTLVKEHPPRDGDDDDKEIGFNQEEVGDLLVPQSMVAPTFKSEAFRDEFLDGLSDAQFELLYNAAFLVNRGSVPDPKADMSSRVSQIFAETSTSPERLGG